MWKWQRIALLFVVGFLMASCVGILSINQVSFAYWNGQSIGLYNSQRVMQLDSLISLNDNDYQNDIPIWKDIDVHGQLFYIVLSEIGARCGQDAMSMFLAMQIMCILIMILFYPLMMYFLTDKLWIGVISPILLYIINASHFFNLFSDTYYAQPWSILFSLPLLVLICRKERWGLEDVIAILMAIVIMIIANLVRASSGITILLSFIVILGWRLLRSTNWKQRLGTIGVGVFVLFSYCSLENVLVKMISFFHPSIPKVTAASPWHAIWCGLGYYENDFGFKWSDWAAYEYAAEVMPGVVNYSESYYKILKNNCLEVLKSNPDFIFETYLKKFFECMKLVLLERMGVELLCTCVLASIVILIHKRTRGRCGTNTKYYNRTIFWWLVFCIIALIGGVAQGVVGIPKYGYILGGYAAVNCMIFGLWVYIIIEVCDLISIKNKIKG